jgi:hypothetical protein
VNGQRAITRRHGSAPGPFFGTSAEFWLNLQSLYELRRAVRRWVNRSRLFPPSSAPSTSTPSERAISCRKKKPISTSPPAPTSVPVPPNHFKSKPLPVRMGIIGHAFARPDRRGTIKALTALRTEMLVAGLAACLRTAQAEVIEFNVSATMLGQYGGGSGGQCAPSGCALSGNIVIDNTTGAVLSET